ncbi:hypothetical protein ACFLTP_08780 [Chloroflexota bacterium]
MKKTGKPIVAGILNIIAGALSLLGAIGVIIGIIFFVSFSTQPILTDMWRNLGDLGIGSNLIIILLLIGAIFSAILGILPLLGGIYALQRKKWGLALAGSIVAILSSTILGIITTILVAVAKDEFE